MPDKNSDTIIEIPQSKTERSCLAISVRDHITREKPVGPLTVEQLRSHAEKICDAAGISRQCVNYVIILVNNQLWYDTVAAIPYNRRLLLLPKCLRDSNECPAEFDEIGLLCEHCGRCSIGKLKAQAEKLGYAVLIAEGSPVVMSLIERGKVEAIIGVSCMSVLEKAFPYMEAGAVPGLAIPLLRDGCANTDVDIDVVWDAIYANASDTGWRLNLGDLRSQIDRWFTEDSLRDVLGFERNTTRQVEQLALKWLSKAGKRWRPFLAAGIYQAIAEDSTEDLRKVAVAVECFHKASLIHDDIEDDDNYRYGEKTLNAEYGIPIALNVGDFLLGEGYRLLAECDVADLSKAKMLRIAAEGHRNLCLGQGEELAWMRQGGPLSSEQVLDIFSKKTSPAFEVALKLGATLAGADKLDAAIAQYSKALGVAYQIRDDIDDFNSPSKKDDALALRPSLLLALACHNASGSDKELLESVWDRSGQPEAGSVEIRKIIERLDVESEAGQMLELRKLEAIGALNPLDNSSLKSLLRKIICKIFDDIEVMGCCNDTKRADARNGKPG